MSKLDNKIRLNFKCNNKCVFCFNKWDDKYLTSFNDIQNEITAVDREKFDNIDFYGAEPLTDKCTLSKALKLTSSLGFTSSMASNCTLLNKDIVAIFNKYGVTGIRTSLHGYNDKSHDLITRRHGSFNELINGLKFLLREFNGKIIINTVITKLNYKFLNQIINLLEEIDEFQRISFKMSGLSFNGSKHLYKSLCVEYDKLQTYLERAVKQLEKNKREFYFERLPLCLINGYDEKFMRISKSDKLVYVCPVCDLCSKKINCFNHDVNYKRIILKHK